MRKAYDRLKELFIANPLLQDVIETAAMSAGSAGYQALFTDMDANEIAASTLVGAGLGLAARPIGGQVGRVTGRVLDNRLGNALDGYDAAFPLTRDGSAAVLRALRQRGMDRAQVQFVRDGLEAKRNMVGTDAGKLEGALSMALRNRADNLAQGGYAFISPMFVESGEDNV